LVDSKMQAGSGRAALLAQAGTALYGRRWVAALSEALTVPYAEVRLWSQEKRQPPPSIWPDVLRIVQAKQRELTLAAKYLKAQIAEDRAAQLGIVARQIRAIMRREPPEKG
jgi:hypothetical protein